MTDQAQPNEPVTDEQLKDNDAVIAFRTQAAAMGIEGAEIDDLIESAREAARSGRIGLREALGQEMAELTVHLGRAG